MESVSMCFWVVLSHVCNFKAFLKPRENYAIVLRFPFISLSFWLFIWSTPVTNAEALTSSCPFIHYYIDWTSLGQLCWLLLQTLFFVLLVSLGKILENVHFLTRRKLFLNSIFILHISYILILFCTLIFCLYFK